MEKNYEKLIGLSGAVEIKLEKMTTANDMLQALQVRIRDLDELRAEVVVTFAHFCFEIRRVLIDRFPQYLTPRQVYGLK